MKDRRKMLRRMAGLMMRRLPELELDEVEDPRDRRGRRWKLAPMLSAVVCAMAAGMKSLRELESLTDEMGDFRRRLGIDRRLPDTTVWDALVRLEPNELRAVIHRQVQAAARRKALEPEGLPFSVASLDGKFVTSTEPNHRYAQGQPATKDKPASGRVRTVTATLTSSSSRICLDAIPIPAGTNEMGYFQEALKKLCAGYSRRLFEVVTYDAGATCGDNLAAVLDQDLEYVFALKGGAGGNFFETTRATFEAMTDDRAPAAETRDVLSGNRITHRRVWLWSVGESHLPGLKTLVRVQSETVGAESGSIKEDRYFVSSLDAERITPAQWLLLIRGHWRVENDCHKTWDVSFEEDEHPWMRAHPSGMVALKLLRRIAYNLLALFRSVTQRSDERRGTPWKDLFRWTYQMCILVTDSELDGLRLRPPLSATLA